MTSFNTNIKVETTCSLIKVTLWESSTVNVELANATSAAGENRTLDPGTIHVSLSSVGQVPGTTVKVSVSTPQGSDTKIRRISKKGKIESLVDFTIDATGGVS
jgi:uncharacterized membrane protein